MSDPPPVSTWTFETVHEGQEAAFETILAGGRVDQFVAVSGDCSPLHVDSAFAAERGFAGRVVHGALLGALVSRLVGVHLPGRDCLLHDLQLKFIAPALVGDAVRVHGVVDQKSDGARAIVVRVSIENTRTGALLARGKATVGFTGAG